MIHSYKGQIQIAIRNLINSSFVKIKQKCLHSISNITSLKNKNTFSFVAKTKTHELTKLTHILGLLSQFRVSRWKYELIFHDEPSIVKTHHFLVRVTIALTHDPDVDRQGVLKADGFYLDGLSLLTFWGTALHSQRHTENHLQVSHEKKAEAWRLMFFISF